jgi:hypothetical protein
MWVVFGGLVNQFSVIKKLTANRLVTNSNWLMVALLYTFKMSLKTLKTLKI